MSLELKVYDNGDHTCLVWLPSDGKALPNCRGFAIRRLHDGKEDYLHGFVGFSDSDKLDPANPWKFPLQRFLWWDYEVQPRDTIQYSVVPVVGPSKDKLSLDTRNASPFTPQMKITGQSTPHIAAYFNKGIIAAQWVSRALAAAPKKSKITDLVKKPGNQLRIALSGLLRPQILAILEEARKNKGKIYAALYELNDLELIQALQGFGRDCNLILGNGAFGKGPHPEDENWDVRAKLKKQINVFDRIVTKGHFAHNKILIICDSGGNPQRVLTGSTNWTFTGLCTQANNALIIDDPQVAADFLAAWSRLKAAGNGYPPALVAGNSTAKTFQIDGCSVTPWFVKTSAAQDLENARKLINAAKEGILFLFFNPGIRQEDPTRQTLLQTILERHDAKNRASYNPNLYIRGVVNQDIPQLTKPGAPVKGQTQTDDALDPSKAAPNPVTLYKGAIEPPQRLSHDVLVPHNIKEQFHNWEAELLGASMVNIHSKVVVLDPFGDHPVVMTGSHNLGFKASNANDDNLVIIEGNAPLAAAYAVNIIAIYHTYRWNSYVEAHRKDPAVWHGLVDNDQWQASYLTGDELAELKFWLGERAASATTPTPHAVHAVSASKSGTRSAAPRRAKGKSRAKRAHRAKRTGKRK